MNKKLEYWLKRLEQENQLIHDRTNVFLLINSIFIGGFAVSNYPPFRLVLSIFGLFFNLNWLYIGERELRRYRLFRDEIKKAEKELPENERFSTIESKLFEERAPRCVRTVNVLPIICRGYSGASILLWVILLFFVEKL